MLVDIHTHLAWGIDDGLETIEDAKKALENAKQDGISKIIATPHFVPGTHNACDKERIKSRIDEFISLAKTYDIEVYAGCEVFLNFEYLEMIQNNTVIPLNNSRYLLVEFDVRKDITKRVDIEDMLYEIKIRNYVPVIAHAERYFHSHIDLKRVRTWIDNGCLIQVNRCSILGLHGSQNEYNAHKLLKNALVHIVASDAHCVSGNRNCRLNDVYEKISSKYGKINADLLCIENPMHIIHDESVASMKIKKSLWNRIYSREV